MSDAFERLAARLALLLPSRALLPGYVAALERGWSPNTMRDVSAEQLGEIARDPGAFLDGLLRQDGTVRAADGTALPKLPGPVYWLDDGAFCGAINLRYVPGTDALPPHVSGHVGYAIVPWKRRLGYATHALKLLLPIARAAGLARVLVTCDIDNIASRKVILANGGVAAGTAPPLPPEGATKVLFWVSTG
jgi:predicted acetyltransferase